jgi:glycosyltransferase involved in cell wall biosynthesis
MDSQKKLIIFLPNLNGGGAEKIMTILANALAERNFSVTFVLGVKTGVYLKEVSPNVNLVDLKANRIALSFFKLIQFLRFHKPDYILSTLDHANIVIILAKIVSRTHGKVVLRQASTLDFAKNSASSFFARLVPYLVRISYPLADAIVALSNEMKNDLTRKLPSISSKVFTIFNPSITADLFEKSAVIPDHPWFFEKKCPIIVAVGRLSWEKNFHSLILAVHRVKATCDVRLLILGEGSDHLALTQLIYELNLQNHVQLVGFVSNPFSFMRYSDVFVLSSIAEGTPNALIQALALGTKVIATDCPGGTAEILDFGRLGKIVPVDNADLLSEAILEVINKRYDAPKVTELDLKHFFLETAVTSYVDLFSRLDPNN